MNARTAKEQRLRCSFFCAEGGTGGRGEQAEEAGGGGREGGPFAQAPSAPRARRPRRRRGWRRACGLCNPQARGVSGALACQQPETAGKRRRNTRVRARRPGRAAAASVRRRLFLSAFGAVKKRTSPAQRKLFISRRGASAQVFSVCGPHSTREGGNGKVHRRALCAGGRRRETKNSARPRRERRNVRSRSRTMAVWNSRKRRGGAAARSAGPPQRLFLRPKPGGRGKKRRGKAKERRK